MTPHAATGSPQAPSRARSNWQRFLDDARRPDALRKGAVATLAVLLTLFLFPVVLSGFWIKILTSAAYVAIVALGANMLYGRVGMVSLGQIALYAVGAWTFSRLSYATALPVPVLLLVAGVIAGLFGIVVGLPALRLSGLYLALITLMAAGAITVVLKWSKFPTGGGGFKGFADDVSSRAPVRRPDFALSDTAYFRFCVIVAALMFLLVVVHLVSKPGRAWAAIRQSEAASVAAGINVTLYKLWAFALAAFITGIAGGLLAANVRFPAPTQFPTQDSVILLAVILMGGIYSLWGAVLAALLLRVLPELLEEWGVTDRLLIILFGLGVIHVMLMAPRGLIDQVPRDLRRVGSLINRKLRIDVGPAPETQEQPS